MHEFSAAQWIVETALREASRLGAKEVREVHVVIGELSLLNVEQVRFWFDVLKEDSMLKGARLVVERREGRVRCPHCGYEGPMEVVDDPAYHIAFPTLACPSCGMPVEIVEGRDCLVKHIVVVK